MVDGDLREVDNLPDGRIDVDGLGQLDVYQWLWFLAQHARRHLEQLTAWERLRAAP